MDEWSDELIQQSRTPFIHQANIPLLHSSINFGHRAASGFMLKKKLVFSLAAFLPIFVLADTCIYFVLKHLNSKRNLFYQSRTVSPEKVQAFIESRFDPELGWNMTLAERSNLGTRRQMNYPRKEKYKIKIFGDSFVYGAEVSAEHTFSAFVEEKTAWDCLNFGVGAYGPDQAFLNYKRTQIPTEYAILGVLSENIGRVVSHYPGFYMRMWAPPKPRFIADGDGFRLIDAPIRTVDDLKKLDDSAYIESLKPLDYWPFYYDEILNAPARLHWPASYTILKHFSFFWSRGALETRKLFSDSYEDALQTFKYTHLYQSRSEALRILEYIVDEFVKLAENRGEIPIVLVLSDQFSIDLRKKYERNLYQPLIDFLQRRNYEFLDVGEVFVNEDYGQYFNFYNSHYSPEGNSRVAEAIVNHIQRREEMQSASQ